MPDSRNKAKPADKSAVTAAPENIVADGVVDGVADTDVDPISEAIFDLLTEIKSAEPINVPPDKIPSKEVHYVAISGGVDSVVLAHALANSGLAIHLLHVNHHRMAAAAKWQQRCEQLAIELNCPISILDGTIEQQRNLEANLRQQRYSELAKAVGKNSLWLAHHQDDQSEGFFLRLLRGSGAHALVSLRRVRNSHGMTLLRPFLRIKKNALTDYAVRHELTWLDDASNEDLTFRRNIWRHKILPIINRYFPTFEQSLIHSIEILERESSVLDEFARDWLLMHSIIDTSPLSQGDSRLINISALNTCSVEKKSIIIRYYLREHGADMPPLKRLDSFLNQIAADNNNAILAIAKVELRCWKGYIYYFNKSSQHNDFKSNHWRFIKSDDVAIRLDNTKYQAHGSDFSIDSGYEGIVVTHPNDEKKHTKLKKLLTKSSVPPWQRPHLPVVRFNEEVIYIPAIYVHPNWRAAPADSGQKMVYFD